MARIVKNGKGFKVIALSNEECEKLGWGIMMDSTPSSYGMICMWCDNIIMDEVYYVAVLNDVMDKKCYDEWISTATYYPEDKPVEDRNFNYYKNLLNL